MKPLTPEDLENPTQVDFENDKALMRYINEQLAGDERYLEFSPWDVEGAKWNPERHFWASLRRVLSLFAKSWKVYLRCQDDTTFRSNHAFVTFGGERPEGYCPPYEEILPPWE